MTLKLRYIPIVLITATALSISSLSVAQATDISAATKVAQIEKQAVEKTPRAASWQGKNLALRGRDVVSFFKNDTPQTGSKKYTANWDNTTWRFSSDKNRKLFLADPEKYAPQFGGFCPVALADNNAKIGHVNQYTVHEEKLYLNYNRRSKNKFSDNPDNFLLRAQLNF